MQADDGMGFVVAEFNEAGQYGMRDTGLSDLDIMRISDKHKRTCRGRVPREALQDLSNALTGRIAIGLSGGKDSLYLLIRAVDEGLNPLAVCVDTGFMAAVALRNVARATDQLGVDCVFVRSHRAEFADIYRRHIRAGSARADHAFSVCRDCHLLIDSIIHNTATQFGCSRAWSGISPDNGVLLRPGETLDDYQHMTGTDAPLCDWAYDPERVRAFVKRRIRGVALHPVLTNCQVNYWIMDEFAKAHGHNPYDAFFVQHGRKAFRRWRCLDWLARATGYISRRAGAVRQCLCERGEP